MRVGLLIYGSLETRSGGYLYDRYLVEHLRSHGDRVEIVSLPWRNYLAHLGDNFSLRLAHQLRSLDVDVLIQDELNHPSLAWLNGWLKPQLAYPIISLVHHLRSDERRPGWQNGLYRLVERRYLQCVDGFIFNSQATRVAVEAVFGQALRSPFLIATPGGDRFLPQVSAGRIKERALGSKRLRLVFLGNLIERKGLHTLLVALSQFPQAAWQLQVVGSLQADPNYARQMRALASQLQLDEGVRFRGELPDHELTALLAGSHALVVPSSYEGFGIVYLEAMGFGLPVIAGTLGGAVEIVEHGQSGFLVPPEDWRALAEVLAVWLYDQDRLAEMGVAARRRHQQFPGWQTSMAAVRAFLLELGSA
ncbi:MAG: glycosyltransferase family 4 protein [Anaerolineales bacterium]|nr:glycosyltransferase family 4 protein [Anaerolineales bacterium]